MENLLKIPYKVFNDWSILQKFLEPRGNPKYVLIGDVNLYWRLNITNLGNLVRVDGNLNTYKSSIQSLGNLEYVDGYLDLRHNPIQSLENLEYVGGYLDLRETPIKSLGKLKYVDGRIILSSNHQIPKEQLTKFKINYI